jgi:L-aminopeptidase/D-esterase-like protein
VTCTCEGRECGDDGCGNTCGSGCTAPECCNPANGQCEAGTPMCNDCCETAGDDRCEDGGVGCYTDTCAFGSDCADCGERTDADRLPEGAICNPPDW